jgi:hypothetical protein
MNAQFAAKVNYQYGNEGALVEPGQAENLMAQLEAAMKMATALSGGIGRLTERLSPVCHSEPPVAGGSQAQTLHGVNVEPAPAVKYVHRLKELISMCDEQIARLNARLAL